jgi:hypothetical protein
MTSEEKIELSSDNEESKDPDEDFQGPHDWRRRLKPVQFQFTADNSKPPQSVSVNRFSIA